MLKEIRELSIRAKIAIIVGFLSGIFLCAMMVESKLSLMGCKSSMTFMEYTGTGTLGIGVLAGSFMIIGLVLFGVLSIPKAIKDYLEKIKEPRKMEDLKYAMKENATFISGIVLALVVAVLILGAALGYAGWLLFC